MQICSLLMDPSEVRATLKLNEEKGAEFTEIEVNQKREINTVSKTTLKIAI